MLDQAAFARSVESYLDSLSQEDVRALVVRSIKRMDGAHRSQLALFLGHDVASHPIDEVGGSPLREKQLREYVESCPLLRERFAAFLHDNPRAAVVLGIGDIEKTGISPFRKIPLRTAAIAVAALLLAFLPLAAQYAHQRGMLSGLDQISLLPAVPAARPVQRHLTAAKPAVHHEVAAPSAHPVEVTKRAVAVHPVKRHAVQRRIAAAPPHATHHRAAEGMPWKFDPRYNPYFNRSRWHVAFHLPRGLQPVDPFAQRARTMVEGYLGDVISGNTASALRHLGLPVGADITNVREAMLVTRRSSVHVVAVNRQPDGSAKVEADINGPAGEYFEVFYVARDGPAARIVDRYYIPVNRTAEERAARLLAKDGRN